MKNDYSLSNNNIDEALVKKIFKGLNAKHLAYLISNYPDYKYLELRKILKKKYGQGYFIFGSGSEDLIIRINEFFNSERICVKVISPIFYRVEETLSCYKKIFLPFRYSNKVLDISNLSRKVKTADVVWFSNPNPMNGKIIKKNDLLKIIKFFKKTFFIIDEAAMDFEGKESLIKYANNKSNFIVIKTFSKLYSIAGLRAGFAKGNCNILKKIEKNSLTFPINNLADYCLKKILNDREIYKDIKRRINGNKEALLSLFNTRGDVIINSSANNCIYFKIQGINNLYYELMKCGIISLNLNNIKGFQRGFVRITINSSPRRFHDLYDKLNNFLKKYL